MDYKFCFPVASIHNFCLYLYIRFWEQEQINPITKKIFTPILSGENRIYNVMMV